MASTRRTVLLLPCCKLFLSPAERDPPSPIIQFQHRRGTVVISATFFLTKLPPPSLLRPLYPDSHLPVCPQYDLDRSETLRQLFVLSLPLESFLFGDLGLFPWLWDIGLGGIKTGVYGF